jgi:mRNA-degrading endonuclease HigB of HigAB toxin-antitoxin module
MQIFNKTMIEQFAEKHAIAREALARWVDVVENSE